MQRKKVTTPDGQSFIITVPDGATNAEIQARVEAHVQQKQGGSTKDTLAGIAGNYLDGILPGSAGAVRGAREVVLNAVRAPFSAEEDFEPGKAYSRGQAFQAARQKAAMRDHPTASNVTALAGMGAGLLLPASKIARGASLGQKALAGAKTAGAYGALSGAMSSQQEGVLGKAQDAVSSGALSAATGGAFPYATKVIGGPLAAVTRPLQRPLARAAGQGMVRLGGALPAGVGAWVAAEGRQLSRDPALAAAHAQIGKEIRSTPHPETGRNMRPTQIAQELQRRQDLNVPAVPADLGEGLRERFSKAVKMPGPALASVRRHIETRQQQQSERAAQHIAETLGPIGNVEQQSVALNAQARADAAPLYELSNSQPIPYVQELQELMSRPAGQESMRQAVSMLRNEGQDAFVPGKIERQGGVWEEGLVPSMSAWDYAKTDLDGVVFGGQSPFASVDAGRDMRGATAIRSRLLDLMDGDGAGPRTDLMQPEPAPSRSYQEAVRLSQDLGLPVPPPPSRSNLPVRLDAPAPWTGERLHGEPDGAEAFSAAGRSFVPTNGLNPYWKPARDAYAGPIQNRKALELGQDMAKADATDAFNRMEGMTGSQRDFFRMGHRTGLAGIAQGVRDSSDVVGMLAGSSKKREALEVVHGPEDAAALYERWTPEQDAYRTFRNIGGRNSVQAPDMSGVERQSEDAANGLWHTITGRPLAGIRSFAGALAGSGDNGAATNRHIAEILGEGDRKKVDAAMRGVRREEARRALVNLNAAQSVQQASRFMGGILGTNMIQPAEDELPY